MKNLLLTLPLVLLCSLTSVFAQCPAGQLSVRLEIDPDQYFMEESWQLTNLDGSVVFASDSCFNADLAIFNYCVPANGCTVFRIKDSYGDGITPDGYYKLFANDSLIHENIGGDYHFGEKVYFGCPPGTFCDAPFPVDTGVWTTPAGLAEIWYAFSPADTGTYQISTCFAENLCPTKIWLYDQCNGITLTSNATGANFYAENGCQEGALANVYLAGGSTYYIRLRYATDNCSNAPIHFSLLYNGPVIGCTDPAACNYNPLASVSATCIYPGNPECTNAPDLLVLEDELRNSMYVDVLNNGDACLVSEGCIKGTGARTLVRFTTHIKNIGTQDYFIGSPPLNPNTPSNQFVWDACHNHWHYRGYAEYILYNAAGMRLPIGSKNGFCVLDLECNDGGNGKYTCGNMGVTVNCGDIYDASLPCQWVDITDLPADTYTLVVRVNWDKSPDQLGRIEKNYDNNWAQGCFQLSYNGAMPNVEFLENNCPQYVDCLGETFGEAQIDCEGVCTGTALRGDWDHDAQRNTADVEAYLTAALSAAADATDCRDLYADAQIDVYDAALLQECNLHAGDPNYWGVRVPCDFPTGFLAAGDIVQIFPGLLDTLAKTFDVQMTNPFNSLIGYEFTVSGVQISSVENMSPDFDGLIQFDPAKGRILALSPAEKTIKKHFTPTTFLRIHYEELTAMQACISGVDAVVNSKYQRSNAAVGQPACVSASGTSATQTVTREAFSVWAQPNPFQEKTTLFYPNPDRERMTITLSDLNGKIVRYYPDIRTESVTFERGALPPGMYVYTVQNDRTRVSGKVVAW